MKAQKKKWSKPQLVVIGRGRPEERVLDYCKDAFSPGTPSASHCAKFDDYQCQAAGVS